MTIMNTEGDASKDGALGPTTSYGDTTADAVAAPRSENNPDGTEQHPEEPEEGDRNIFSDANVMSEEEVPAEEVSSGSVVGLGFSHRPISITPEDKSAFLDSVVNNSRFEKDYSLFGGKVSLTVRSLTSEEVQALAAWVVKHGMSEPDWQVSGRYRKYLMAAQVSKYNGVEMPPLEAPLFETLDKDGKSVKEPGWLSRGEYWDGMPSGLVDAILACLANFDMTYSTLCKKAEDANFWNPDTP